jgi:hypothetical protein
VEAGVMEGVAGIMEAAGITEGAAATMAGTDGVTDRVALPSWKSHSWRFYGIVIASQDRQ